MSNPPPGLGGGSGLRGPPPGFGSPAPATTGRGGQDGQGGTATIVRAQIVFLLTTFTEESFEKASGEIRTLASSNGPDMYHHFLRRTAVVANPILQTLIQHSQQYKDDPAAPPPNIPTSGQAALAWRLLVTEAIRASRDVTLAPHFALVMLSPSQGTPLPLPSMRLFNLPPAFLFALTAFTLAAPHVFPPSHPSNDVFHSILRQTFQPAMDQLRAPGVPFWSTNAVPGQQPFSDDLNLQEARSLILALYPRSAPSGGSISRPATPTNPTSPHASPLTSSQRAVLLGSLSVKFSSPAIILQTLSALSPGGPPRSHGSIPLEDILFELGENLTSDEGTVEAVVGRWWGPYLLEYDGPDKTQRVTEEAAHTLMGLCEGLGDGSGRGVDLHGVVKGFCNIDSISFVDLIRSFDTPNTIAAYHTSLPLLLALLVIPSQSPVPPIAGLIPASLDAPVWKNMTSLLAVLNHLTTLPPDALPLFTSPSAPAPADFARIIDPPTNESSMSKAAKQQATEIQSAGLWNTLGLVQVLVAACRMADTDHPSEETAEVGRRATELLDKAAALAPELVLLALEKLPKPLPVPINNLYARLMGTYMSTPPANITSSQLVFHQLRQGNTEGLVQNLIDFYHEDENNLGRVVEIAVDVQILDKLLTSEHAHFALDVASLAANKEYIDLEKWLADGVEVKGEEFLQEVFEFVEHKIRLEIDHQHQPESVPPLMFTLGTDVYSIFLRVIRRAPGLEQEDIARFKRLRTDILIIHPRLLNLRPQSKEEQGFSAAKFNKETVSGVDDMYQRMYSGELKIDDVVAELKRCQKSNDPKEQEIFACALHSIFDEYKFVKVYPPKELTMTGILFGAIIDFRLVSGTPAFVATRYVLDACKTSPHEALYQFGINALSVLRASLVDFPGLCRSLLEIPALHESHPVLINDIVSALGEREDLDFQGGVKLAFPALKLPILVEEGDDEFREPEAGTKDRIMFNINQIAPSNYEQKAADLLNLFEDQYSRWFAHYFIDVRVSLEVNRHDIYMQILDTIASPVLDRHVLWETLRKARDLLNAETTISSASERQILKTVALWLGKITLAKNKPLRLRELNVKDLLIQGYDNKRLIVAIPFVCNLLLACKDSLVFHVPNPWMTAVLSLLAEFYRYAELRLNLKFEIEVLFSKLDVSLEGLEPSNMLRTHQPPPPPQPELPNRLDRELQRATAEIMNGSQRFEPPVDPAFARMQVMQTEQAAQAAQDAFNRRVEELVLALPDYLVFSSEYPVFTAPTLKRVVHHSIDRAIREIVNPVVERSVTIAGISSRDLVQKDFGMEGDASKMRHAAHLMVQNLAGNLAIVTCKEPLRSAMISNIRSMLSQNGFTEESMPESQIAGVVNDNIDAGCSVIKKAAMEKAAKDIDVNLAPQYAARRAHRESRSTQPFWDGASFGVAISHQALPDPLRLRNGGLSGNQLRVYEDFAENARVIPPANGDYYAHQAQVQAQAQQQAQQAQELTTDLVGGPKRGASPMYPEREIAASPALVNTQTALDKFHEIVAEVEKFVSQNPTASIASLPAPNELRPMIQTVVIIASQSNNREGTTLIISQKVVQLLYKSTVQLGREVYVYMLQQLCDISRKVEKEVKQWLIYAEDSRKFNVPVTVTLIRAGFLHIQELDAQLAQVLVRSFSPEMQDFVAGLVRECSLSEHSPFSRNGFAASLAAMLKALEMGHATQAVQELLDDLRGPRAEPQQLEKADAAKPSVDQKLQERLTHYFLEWVRVYSSSATPEVAFVPYITYLQKEGILNGEDVTSAFYRTAVNCAVDLDGGRLDAGKFYGVDALAKLIVLIVKNYGDKSGTSSTARTVYYYNKIITIVAYSLVKRQLEEGFVQRPWTRFFTSMLSELQMIEHSLPEVYTGCLRAFANALGITQPTYAPKFAYGWLSIVSHRFFVSKMLAGNRDQMWTDYHRCLMWLLRFLAPFLNNEDMSPSSKVYYQATLRLLVVIMHDFQDFLVEFYHTISTAIPPHCVQLRNIVLCAFPFAEGPLPNYYKSLDQLVPDMQRFPTVRSDYITALSAGNIRAAIDQHVRTSMPPAQPIVAELKNRIAVKTVGPDGSNSITWNHTLLHAAVFYLGTTGIARIAQQRGVVEFDPKAPEVVILMNLAFALDSEGQYYMLSVIADQLRYPSAHTLFFISFLLFLFSTASQHPDSSLPERIGRIVLERIIASKPHPWGLIVTFVELLDNEQYGFWKQPFVREEEEIYVLFLRAQQNFAAGTGNRGVVGQMQGQIGQAQGAVGQGMVLGQGAVGQAVVGNGQH